MNWQCICVDCYEKILRICFEIVLKFELVAVFFAKKIRALSVGNFSLFFLQTSLNILFILFRSTAFPTFLLTVMPIRAFPCFGKINIIKSRRYIFFPFSCRMRKSFLLRIFSLFLRLSFFCTVKKSLNHLRLFFMSSYS
jgi:hypothetical protein